MKLILTANEFARLSDLSNNVSLAINKIDRDCLLAPPLLDTLRTDLPKFTVLNLHEDGSVEIEYSEQYCLDTFELVERCAIKSLPIFYVLEPVIEKFADAISSLVRVFDNGLTDMTKEWFKDTKADFKNLMDKYMK